MGLETLSSAQDKLQIQRQKFTSVCLHKLTQVGAKAPRDTPECKTKTSPLQDMFSHSKLRAAAELVK